MAENSKIEWTDHTFNPWIGCTQVGPGCDGCYAKALSEARLGVLFGPGQPRRRTAASTWNQPRAWNRKAARLGIRYRVFCASLADVFDNEVPPEWRADLFQLIRETPHLDWLLVTKRIGNVYKMAEAAGRLPDNVWLGITVVNQQEADRDIPKLRNLRQLYEIPVAFLSIEPMLEPIDLRLLFYHHCPNWLDDDGYPPIMDMSTGMQECCSTCDFTGISDELAINWVIVGGESGPKARPMHPDWARSLRDQCAEAGVPFLFKQWGEYGPYNMEPGVAGFWFDPDGHVYQGSTHWPPAQDESRAYMIRWGKKRAGRLLDGVRHDGMPS
ncbi:phage Gp37/Gp68 family protein [Sphingobium sp. JS3065]|uniref:phage Gp37/Gp68 family protein n=1 Tax=Sphingobium sp. JS3065 TaxID=2970925 RepID=UPI00226417C2|nr:phage Gp37/Gp68 family protein [Sphingobium sp. JS3065]UZW55517.1 phage Gp37/Gp68 family protein [Sphingobium sp. JS3065]